MSPADHYKMAESLLRVAEKSAQHDFPLEVIQATLATAQIHATLAMAANHA